MTTNEQNPSGEPGSPDKEVYVRQPVVGVVMGSDQNRLVRSGGEARTVLYIYNSNLLRIAQFSPVSAYAGNTK